MSDGESPVLDPSSAPGAAAGRAGAGPARAIGMRHPAAKAVLGLAWFCAAVVILWFFGSLAMAPWKHEARIGPMRLPGGGHFDLTLGRGASSHCAVRVTRDGKTTEVVILRTACSTMAAHRWMTANEQLPQFRDAVFGQPYTVPAPSGAEETATRTRVLVSCLFTAAAGLVGAVLLLGSAAVTVKLLAPPSAREGSAR